MGPTSQDQPIETIPSQQNVATTEHTTGIGAEDLAKSFSHDQGNDSLFYTVLNYKRKGGAESFFDQLGQNPSQSIDASRSINNQDTSSRAS